MSKNSSDSLADGDAAASPQPLEVVTSAMLHALGRLSVSGVALFDEERFHYVSPPFCYQTGFTEEELLELSPHHVFGGNTFPSPTRDDELLHLAVQHRSGLPRALTARVQKVRWQGTPHCLASTVDLSPPIPPRRGITLPTTH